MFASGKQKRRWVYPCLGSLAGVAAIAPAIASADDCKLSVHAQPQVIHAGQSSDVRVLAHFPTPPAPAGAYAFASSLFDVYASDPMWTFASAGAIVGNDVLGIDVGQAHLPHLGLPADPSNPMYVWHGVFEPQSDAPALVEIEVDPAEFSVYPSKLTSSAAECDAAGGSDFLFVNPRRVGRWLAAPGAGTEMQTHDDVIVDGRIITGGDWRSPMIGIVPARAAAVFDSSTRVDLDVEPETFSATVELLQPLRRSKGDDRLELAKTGLLLPAVQRSRIGSTTIAFEQLETGGYVTTSNYLLADGSVHFFAFDGYLGGVQVASGTLDPDGGYGLIVEAVPQTIEVETESAHRRGDRPVWTLYYDEPVKGIVFGPNGQTQEVSASVYKMHRTGYTSAGRSATVDRGGISLGAHYFAADGVGKMIITPDYGQ